MASRFDGERPDDRHARVLDIASGLFADNGFDAVSLEALARDTEMSTRCLQRLFRGRAGILFGVLERHLGRLFDAVRQPEDWPGEPPVILRAMAVALVECIGANERDHRLLLETMAQLPKPMRDDIALRLRWMAHTFERTLSAALPGLALAPERAPVVSNTLLALLCGHGAWWSWDAPVDRGDYAAAAVDMVLTGRLLA